MLRRPRPRSRRALPLVLGAVVALATAASRDASADPSTTTPEQGYDLGEIQSPRAVGMGGAQTATGSSTTALYMNPANMPFARVYHFEGLAAISPDARRESFGGGVVDSATSKLAGGFGGAWSQLDPDGIKRRWTDFRLALAFPLSDRIALGLTGRYLRVSEDAFRGPFGQDHASGGTGADPIFSNLTFDAGLSVVPTDKLYLGLVGHNLTNPGTGLAPTTLAFGGGYQADTFTVEADGLVDFTTWGNPRGRVMAGGELFVSDHFPLRAGYRYDDGQKAHALSAGLGYVDRSWSVELSGRRDVVADHPMTMFVLGLRYFYESASSTPEEPMGTDY